MTRLEQQERLSLFAESMARTLGEAVHGKAWHQLETHAQSDCRLACESLIRRMDPMTERLAREQAHRRVRGLLVPRLASLQVCDVLDVFDAGLQSYFLHLSHGPLSRPESTSDEDLAYTRGTGNAVTS